MPNVYDTRDTGANPATTENVTQVSSGNIRLIRNIYSDSASGDLIWNGRDRIYLSVPLKGLYTTGEFGHAGGKEAVAITGMGYCAGLVLARGHQTRLTNFFACHFSGGLLAFDSFQQVISDWMANTPTTNLLAFAAMGAAGFRHPFSRCEHQQVRRCARKSYRYQYPRRALFYLRGQLCGERHRYRFCGAGHECFWAHRCLTPYQCRS